ncbi:MAG: tRNA 2-selenouridine(34) synthase MnmH, partial [Betaproteobacteria bacterium]|nr:tRNA 2-selenouridine(34) synthase MnmH [Betaproteobacteria bacterium]
EIPGQPQPSQKLFESRLRAALAALDRARTVYVEGESRKIGQLQVPEALITAMRAAACVRLDADLAARVALLMQEYRHFFAAPAALGAQLDCLVPLHGRERVEGWKALAARGAWEELVARLLAEHYDPAYHRSALRNFARLPQATVLRVATADDDAFAGMARELAEAP